MKFKSLRQIFNYGPQLKCGIVKTGVAASERASVEVCIRALVEWIKIRKCLDASDDRFFFETFENKTFSNVVLSIRVVTRLGWF